MDRFRIIMFEAGNGDCFLIKCEGDYKTNILIDFGYSGTYKKHVEKHLIGMSNKGEKLDLVIVTHIDQDHIRGGIRFFEDNGFANNPQIISVGEVWHNSYRHLKMEETQKILTKEERKYITTNSIVPEQDRSDDKTDTSGKQGSRLAANLYKYGYDWNTQFMGQAISYKGKEPIFLNDEVQITVLSPTMRELEKLKKVWRDELKDRFPTIALNNEIIFDDAIECISLMRRPNNVPNLVQDTSTTTNLKRLADMTFKEDIDEINNSSITCIIEFHGKKVLFLGDSVSSIVETQLNRLYKETGYPINFDAIKIAHHGSSKNTSMKFLDMVDSKHYFISTNGKVHQHPDIETIAKIIVRDNRGFIRNIYFTNRLTSLERFENKEMQKTYKYKTHYRDAAEDSLQIYL